jgi:hypothetical protein
MVVEDVVVAGKSDPPAVSGLWTQTCGNPVITLQRKVCVL